MTEVSNDKSELDRQDAMAPLPKSLAEAPEDDEPLTPEEIAMLDARLAEAASGRTIPHDEVVRRLRLAYRD